MQMGKYLYNGVSLSEIPTVGGCPYSLIVNADGVYLVSLSGQKTEAYNTGSVMLSTSGQTFKYEDGQWVKTSWTSFPSVYPLIWTNYDLYYKTVDSYGDLSGTLYLAASEPVPIVPTPPSPQTAFCIGKAFGRLIRDSISAQST